MYVCGMTVYDYCHLGHARVMVVFDIIQRWLKAQGYQVTYVRNITDIDDKIIQRAQLNKESIRALTDRMVAAMHEDADALGVERPSHEPRATEHIPAMLSIIDGLQQKGLAYQSPNGDMLYSVRKFPDYGKLSGKSLDDLRAGERVALNSDKQDPLDFVLWKSAKPEEPDEAKWSSPYGLGRPGWHIECSAMGRALLGEHFDIHGGGADLLFPHHENEIAQSEGCHSKPLANYWLHNGFVRVDNEKMSKSLGNFFTIREILQRYDPETVRFFIARSHYRSPLNYSDAHLNDAHSGLRRLYTALSSSPSAPPSSIDWAQPHAARFQAAMNEDFGTPEAVAVLFDLATEINRNHDPALATLLRQLGGLLGLLQADPKTYLQSANSAEKESAISAPEIETRIAERAAAKAAKDYARADAIRQALLEQGILLKDSPTGSTWERIALRDHTA